jgi:alkylation response protein AidB-like acyl-CoA dehydrogenase
MRMSTVDIEVGLSEEDAAIRDVAHQYAEEVLRPAGIAMDRMTDPADTIGPDSPIWNVIEKYHQIGLGGITYDDEMDPYRKARLMAVVNEELAWGDVGLSITVGLSGFHQPWVQQTGDAALIERFCDADNPTIGCWALTEPDHGSDTVALTEPGFSNPDLKANCTATKDGNEYIIRGQKAAWVSNGPIADMAVLFCTLDQSQGFKGGGVFLVPLDLPGVERPRPLDKLGQRSLNQGEIYFDDVRIPESHMALGPDLYAIGLEMMLAHANAGMGQIFVGIARAAYEHALAYAHERVQGGVPIIEHQSVKSRLFKMFTKVEAARALARRVAYFNAGGAPSIAHCIASKTFITNTAFEVASDALQIFGGNGVSREYPMEKLIRDARSSLIEDGCNEVLAIVGGSRL